MVFIGGDFESTKALINNGKIKKNNIRFFLGYTGWGKPITVGISNSWIVAANSYKK
jgi:putative transcriptional regulator